MEWDSAEVLSFASALSLYLLYHIAFVIKHHRNPLSTRHGINQLARSSWVSSVMTGQKDILAVQTIRNSMMAATLFATTSLTLSSVVAAYLYREDAFRTLAPDPLDGAVRSVRAGYKLFILLITYIIAFFGFMQSIRGNSTASILIGIPEDCEGHDPKRVADIVQRSALMYSIGSRAFVFSFVVILWIVGAYLALVGCLGILALQGNSDFAVSDFKPGNVIQDALLSPESGSQAVGQV